MTVEELIRELQRRPPKAQVYKWQDGLRRFAPVTQVSNPSGEACKGSSLPTGAVVLWSQRD